MKSYYNRLIKTFHQHFGLIALVFFSLFFVFLYNKYFNLSFSERLIQDYQVFQEEIRDLDDQFTSALIKLSAVIKQENKSVEDADLAGREFLRNRKSIDYQWLLLIGEMENSFLNSDYSQEEQLRLAKFIEAHRSLLEEYELSTQEYERCIDGMTEIRQITEPTEDDMERAQEYAMLCQSSIERYNRVTAKFIDNIVNALEFSEDEEEEFRKASGW